MLIAAIPSPPTNVLELGPFTVHIYGLCYAAAVIAAVAITRRRWVARGARSSSSMTSFTTGPRGRPGRPAGQISRAAATAVLVGSGALVEA